MNFGETLFKLRKEKGLSQEALAERLGTTRQAVSKWENDQGFPETEKLLALSNLFEVPVDTLLKGENAVPAADRERGWYVSRETARCFLAGERRCARYLGLAFFFWALAGVPWVMLPPGGGQRPLGMGLCVLLGICAAVAAMFSQREDYAVLRREPLLLDQAVLKELRDEYRALRGRYLLVAAPSVVLFVSGLLALAAASRGMVPWTGYHALAFLVLAAGLWGSVWSLSAMDSYELLVENQRHCAGVWFKLRRRLRGKLESL